MGAIILSKFGKSQLCLVKDVAQGWSRKTLHLTNQWQHLPALSGMKETKAIDNKEESHLCSGTDTGMTGPFLEFLCYSNMFPCCMSVCLSIGGKGLCCADFTKPLEISNHCINQNPNIVLSNSIYQGTFLDRNECSTEALSQAVLAVSLLKSFLFLLNY